MTDINLYGNLRWRLFCVCLSCLVFVSCKDETPVSPEVVKGTYDLYTDSSYNQLDFQMLNPSENKVYQAYLYREYDPAYRDLYTNEFYLRDSSGDSEYRLRILTHLLPLDTFSYETTDQKYNPFKDKVYIEFFRQGTSEKESLFVSQIQQNDNYFSLSRVDSASCDLRFRVLTRSESPERYAIISGRFRLKR